MKKQSFKILSENLEFSVETVDWSKLNQLNIPFFITKIEEPNKQIAEKGEKLIKLFKENIPDWPDIRLKLFKKYVAQIPFLYVFEDNLDYTLRRNYGICISEKYPEIHNVWKKNLLYKDYGTYLFQYIEFFGNAYSKDSIRPYKKDFDFSDPKFLKAYESFSNKDKKNLMYRVRELSFDLLQNTLESRLVW